MNKLSKFCIYTFFILLSAVNVRGEEIQLSDYIYTAHRDMLDGYSYVEFSGGNCIVKPDGTYLYDPAEFYTVYPETYNSEIAFSFEYPQLKCGNKFIVYNKQDKKAGVMNHNGEFETKCQYKKIYYMGKYYYEYYYGHEDNVYRVGILDAKTGKELAYSICGLYMDLNKEKIACLQYTYESDKSLVDVYFYDKGELYDTREGINYFEDDVISDKNGETLYKCNIPSLYFKEKDPETGEISDKWYYDFLDVKTDIKDNTYTVTGLDSHRVDRSCYFKSEEINGITYYAMYTDTPKNQKDKYCLTIPETVPSGHKENIQKAYNEGLLKNNFMCCYDQGITRGEMAFILSNMYCKLKKDPSLIYDVGLKSELSENRKAYNTFITKMCCRLTGVNYNKHMEDVFYAEPFEGTEDVYCLFAYKYNLMDPQLGINNADMAMSKEEVSECLTKTASKFGLYLTWKNKETFYTNYTGYICPRETAYSEIYKLYDLCKDPPIGTPVEIYVVLCLGALFLVRMYFKYSYLYKNQYNNF